MYSLRSGVIATWRESDGSELALVIVEPLDVRVSLVDVVHEVELLPEDLAADGAAVPVLVAGGKVAEAKVPTDVALVPEQSLNLSWQNAEGYFCATSD